jgi:hypothetical protein
VPASAPPLPFPQPLLLLLPWEAQTPLVSRAQEQGHHPKIQRWAVLLLLLLLLATPSHHGKVHLMLQVLLSLLLSLLLLLLLLVAVVGDGICRASTAAEKRVAVSGAASEHACTADTAATAAAATAAASSMSGCADIPVRNGLGSLEISRLPLLLSTHKHADTS